MASREIGQVIPGSSADGLSYRPAAMHQNRRPASANLFLREVRHYLRDKSIRSIRCQHGLLRGSRGPRGLASAGEHVALVRTDGFGQIGEPTGRQTIGQLERIEHRHVDPLPTKRGHRPTAVSFIGRSTLAPANLFRLFDAGQRQGQFDNIAAAVQGVPEHIQRRQIVHFTRADPLTARASRAH